MNPFIRTKDGECIPSNRIESAERLENGDWRIETSSRAYSVAGYNFFPEMFEPITPAAPGYFVVSAVIDNSTVEDWVSMTRRPVIAWRGGNQSGGA